MRIKRIPGIIPIGGFCPIHHTARSELTGTSKNTISETIAGETRFKAELNMVCPKIWAPAINPIKIHHSRAEKLKI
jgi:hypothetical protein